MSSVKLQSLNELRGTLVRRGIPPRYVHRVTTELREHAEDLSKNGDSADTSLGELSILADEITHTYKSRTFAGRHPWLTFGLLSLPFIIVTYTVWMFVALAVPLVALAPLIEDSGLLKALLVSISNVGIMIVPSMLCTWTICRVARRAGLSWRLTSLACLPVLLIALHLVTKISFAPTAEVHGTLQVGLTMPLLGINSHDYGWSQLLQAAIPVLILAGLLAREARKSPQAVVPEVA